MNGTSQEREPVRLLEKSYQAMYKTPKKQTSKYQHSSSYKFGAATRKSSKKSYQPALHGKSTGDKYGKKK